MWIRHDTLEKLVAHCDERPALKSYGLLYLVAYAFLLRLPSEALPMQLGGTASAHSVLKKEGEFVTLTLRRRKNKAVPSSITRGCWCNRSTRTCPLHRLGPLLEAAETGMQPFEGLTAARALGKMRDILEDLGRSSTHRSRVLHSLLPGIDEAAAYRTHDLRRGHALDLQLSGGLVALARGHVRTVLLQEPPCGRYWQQAIGSLLRLWSIWINGSLKETLSCKPTWMNQIAMTS